MKNLLAALLVPGLLAGCQTTTPFAAPDARWTTHQGQLRYSSPGQALIGEAIVATLPPSSFQMNYTAGPGFPLLDLRMSPTQVRAQGVLARGRWQGAPGSAPAKLQAVVALAEVFQQLTAQPLRSDTRTLQAAGWTAAATASAGSLTALDVRFPASDERFQFVFSPRR